ncbi:MAG: GTP 3',8-cyclase MoaA [Candidatus Thorarchaeota archaeon]
MVDPFGRPVNYLRISLTQRCNHACFFCHSEGEESADVEMSPTEIERLVQFAADRGVTKVKLTGGEPLLRDDILEIVRRISPLVQDLSLTTNGALLENIALDLKNAGLNRVNVSLHSLDPMTYREVTGSTSLSMVKRGIAKAVEVGLTPLKINMTLLRTLNESQIRSMLEFAANTGAVLQLIELQDVPTECSNSLGDYRADVVSLEKYFEQIASDIVQRTLHGRKHYTIHLSGNSVVVEIIRSMHNSNFCRFCTRLRVTSDGNLKPCLYRNDNLIPIRSILSNYKNDTELLQAYKAAVGGREPYWHEEE